MFILQCAIWASLKEEVISEAIIFYVFCNLGIYYFNSKIIKLIDT